MTIATDELNDVTVSPEWLARQMGAEDLVVVDVSWYQAHENRNAEAEFVAEHIPGAVHISLDELSDATSGLPNTLPSIEELSTVLGNYGISRRSAVVCYDATGFRTAPRLWWLLKWSGHERVALLDGGLPAWKAAGYDVESGTTRRRAAHFTPPRGAQMRVSTAEDILQSLGSGKQQIVDSRPRDRFDGTAPEPRPGLRRGHIPGSVSAELKLFVDPNTNRLRPMDAIARQLRELGVDLDRPIVATCGSGVAATGLIALLQKLGVSAALYDGSWTEWGSRADLPVSSQDEPAEK